MKISDTYKNFEIARAMFGLEEFQRNQGGYCDLVKRLRKLPITLVEDYGDGTLLVSAQSGNPKLDGVYFMDSKYLGA